MKIDGCGIDRIDVDQIRIIRMNWTGLSYELDQVGSEEIVAMKRMATATAQISMAVDRRAKVG